MTPPRLLSGQAATDYLLVLALVGLALSIGENSPVIQLVQALAGKGDKKALAVRYASLPFKSGLDPGSGNNLEDFHLAPLLVMLGERDIALDYLERFASEVGSTVDWSIMLPAMDPIRCEPRFVALVKKLGTRDPHFSKVCGGESP